MTDLSKLKLETLESFFRSVCGKVLGEGMSRIVYEMPALPKLVAKIEINVENSFQNIEEWNTWQEAKEAKHISKWFAPCDYISPDGRILFQQRTRPPTKKQFPNALPAFLTDTKFSNYGMLRGNFVCHDYGTNLLRTTGMTKRTRAVHWWGEPIDS